jgi:hypothetical protein
MVVRISSKTAVGRTVLRVEGLLQAADVESLRHEWDVAGGSVTLELSQLQSADASGVEAIRELVSHGAKLHGVSPFMELLLGTGRATTYG